MPADNEDNLVSKGKPDYVERNKRKITELEKNKEAKEIKVTCPHCSKELYIERATDQCVYCKKPLSEDLIAYMFLRYEDLEIENVMQNQSNLEQENQAINKKQEFQQSNIETKSKKKHHPLLWLISIVTCILVYSIYVSSVPTSGDLRALDIFLQSNADTYAVLGISCEILDDSSNTVLMVIDSNEVLGVMLSNLLVESEVLRNPYMQDEVITTLDMAAKVISESVGFEFKVDFVLDTNPTNVIYSVVGGRVLESDF